MSRAWLRAGLGLSALLIASLAGPAGASAQVAPQAPSGALRADLNGVPIELVQVGAYFCHDFAYPRIHCFRRASDLEAAAGPIAATSGVNWVAGFDYTSFQGPYMYFSQNYSVLATIGWNDRISSYIAVNNQSGRFWTDWFFSGTAYGFCCNQQIPSLGSFDNSFSAVSQP
jgi:hypothetical protein